MLPLIAGYQRFYKAEPDEARNRAHFARLLDDHDAGIQFVALDEAARRWALRRCTSRLGRSHPAWTA